MIVMMMMMVMMHLFKITVFSQDDVLEEVCARADTITAVSFGEFTH